MPKGIIEVLEKLLGIGAGEAETAGVVGDVRHKQLCRRAECKPWCPALTQQLATKH